MMMELAHALVRCAFAAAWRFGAEDVVAHQLDFAAQLVSENAPALPVSSARPSSSVTIGYWANPVVVETNHVFADSSLLCPS